MSEGASIETQRDALAGRGAIDASPLDAPGQTIAAVLESAGWAAEDYYEGAVSYKVTPTFTVRVDGDSVSAIAREPITGAWLTVTDEDGPWWRTLRTVLAEAELNRTRESRIEQLKAEWQSR